MNFEESQQFFQEENLNNNKIVDNGLAFQNDNGAEAQVDDLKEIDFSKHSEFDELSSPPIKVIQDVAMSDDDKLPEPLPTSSSPQTPLASSRHPIKIHQDSMIDSKLNKNTTMNKDSKLDTFSIPNVQKRNFQSPTQRGKRFDFSFSNRFSPKGPLLKLSNQSLTENKEKENVSPLINNSILNDKQQYPLKNSELNHDTKIEEEILYQKENKDLERLKSKDIEAKEMLQQIISEMDESIQIHKDLNSELIDLKHKLSINLDPAYETLIQLVAGAILIQDQLLYQLLLEEEIDNYISMSESELNNQKIQEIQEKMKQFMI